MSRLTTVAFELWLQECHTDVYGDDYTVHFTLGRIPDMPNRAASIVRATSPRTVLNGTFEEIIYRIQSRGASNNHDDAELIANDIDKLLDNQTMFDIGDVYILSIVSSSRPRLLNITDPESRFNFTADYKVTASLD